jgi:hypothetical protein
LSSSNIDGFGKLAPIMEIAKNLPIRFAIIDDEQFAAGFACAVRFGMEYLPLEE